MKKSETSVRGSLKHVLDWTSKPSFADELVALCQPVNCSLTPESVWMPKGYADAREARLESFAPRALGVPELGRQLQTWWLKHPRGANTPNWDIALSCEIDRRPGLILVEAKANVPELSRGPKARANEASERRKENHARITMALAEASAALGSATDSVRLSADDCYQVSNRLAFSWRLASMGIPVVLLYLGFTGDEGIRDAGDPFADDAHWQAEFAKHLAAVAPTRWINSHVDCGAAGFWLLSRSRAAIAHSPPRSNADAR
jgi:hypothetical protein